jgi:hypothetical protein
MDHTLVKTTLERQNKDDEADCVKGKGGEGVDGFVR